MGAKIERPNGGLPAGKPFSVSEAYIDWAHSSAAGDGHALAGQLVEAPTFGVGRHPYMLFTLALHVAEIADVAELYVGAGETDLRAANVRARALKWLSARGLTVRGVLASTHGVGSGGTAAR